MKVCLLFVCCTIVGSHAMGYYGNKGGGYRGMTLNVQDGDGKTLNFKTSQSSSEENTRNSREAGPQTNQERGGGFCWPGCRWVFNRCVCWNRDTASGEPTKSTKTLQESAEGKCRPHCRKTPSGGCICRSDKEEPTNPTEEKSSVQKLVSAGLDLLKAGKKLKFNVDVKNPEALLGAKKTSQESGEGHLCRNQPGCVWNGHRCVCPHKDSEEPTKPTETNQERGGGFCWPGCRWVFNRCVCWNRDTSSGEPTKSTKEKSSVQKLVSAGLDLLKAGQKLKFNVDMRNPEALLSEDDTSKPKQRFRAWA